MLENAKDIADRLLAELGKSLSVEDFRTDAKGLARLSVPNVGMVDFELYDEQRYLGIFTNIGNIPEDSIELLHKPVELGQMHGFWFSVDEVLSQVFLTTEMPLDGLSNESLQQTFDRLVEGATYWKTNLATIQDTSSAHKSTTDTSSSLPSAGAFIA